MSSKNSPVTVRFFASFEERVGTDETTVDLDNPRNLGEFLDQLVEAYPEIEDLLDHAAVALNLETVDPARSTVKPGDEVGLLPPFGGGVSRHG